jgi:hypothetical protein
VVCSVSLGAAACARKENPSAQGTATASSSAAPRRAETAPLATDNAPMPSSPLVDTKLRGECENICEPTRALNCKHPEGCIANCLVMATATPCSAAIASFFSCLTAEPAAHWQCDPESGFAQIRDGYCDTQQAGALACMNEKMR